MSEHFSVAVLTIDRALERNQAFASILQDIKPQLDKESRRKLHEALKDPDDDDFVSSPKSPTDSEGEELANVLSIENEVSPTQLCNPSVSSESAFQSVDRLFQFEHEDSTGVRHFQDSQIPNKNGLGVYEPYQTGGFPTISAVSAGDPWQKSSSHIHDGEQTSFSCKGYPTDLSCYVDDINLDVNSVNPSILPPEETAKRLWDTYRRVAGFITHMLDPVFELQLESFYSQNMHGPFGDRRYEDQAVLNAIFAIGAFSLHQTSDEWRAHPWDHHVYMWRAFQLLEHQAKSVMCPSLSHIRVSLNTCVSSPELKSCRLLDFSRSIF